MDRSAFIDHLVHRMLSMKKPHPLRVGIDGIDGAGKTYLADELIQPIQDHGRQVIRASIDGFHNPRRKRYQRGRSSPEGYYRDSFDYSTLTSWLLDPLGPVGSGRYRTAAFDYRTDSEVDCPIITAEQDAVLIFDGVFLHCRELLPYWDLTVFLDSSFEAATGRMAERDGCSPDISAPENRRYIDGQKIYIRECRPSLNALICVDYSDMENPVIIGNVR